MSITTLHVVMVKAVTQVQSSIGHVHVQTGQGHVPKHPEVDGRGLYVSLHVRITDIILEKLWPLH